MSTRGRQSSARNRACRLAPPTRRGSRDGSGLWARSCIGSRCGAPPANISPMARPMIQRRPRCLGFALACRLPNSKSKAYRRGRRGFGLPCLHQCAGPQRAQRTAERRWGFGSVLVVLSDLCGPAHRRLLWVPMASGSSAVKRLPCAEIGVLEFRAALRGLEKAIVRGLCRQYSRGWCVLNA